MSKTVTLDHSTVDFTVVNGLTAYLYFTLKNTDGTLYTAPTSIKMGVSGECGSVFNIYSSGLNPAITITQNTNVVDVVIKISSTNTALLESNKVYSYTIAKEENGEFNLCYSGNIDIEVNNIVEV